MIEIKIYEVARMSSSGRMTYTVSPAKISPKKHHPFELSMKATWPILWPEISITWKMNPTVLK